MDAATVAIVAATVLSFAVILPQQLSEKGQLRGVTDGKEAFMIIISLLVAALLFALVASEWASLFLALGLGALGVVFVALQVDHPLFWRQHGRGDLEERLTKDARLLAASIGYLEQLGKDGFPSSWQTRLEDDSEARAPPQRPGVRGFRSMTPRQPS